MDDYEKRIVELWSQGYSTSMIASQLGRSKNMICGKIFRMREKGFDLSPRAVVTKVRTETGETKVARRKSTMSKPLLGLVFKKKTEERVRPIVVVKEKKLSNSRNIKFKHLTSESCRYVVNDGRPEQFIFCGAPQERGSYCAEHAAICYMPPKVPEKEYQRANARFK